MGPILSLAQSLPNHFDTNSRELALDLKNVPAIRFLTTSDFPPFNYRDTEGKLIGFNVDLAHAICQNLEIACTMQAWPWEQATDALADKQGDVLLAGVALSQTNGQRFDFSHIYLKFPGRFVAKLSALNEFAFAPSRAQTDGELATGPVQTIAVRGGSRHHQFVIQFFPNASTSIFATEFEALDAVADGEAYAFFGDAMRSSFWLNEHPQCCAFAGEAYFNSQFFGQGLAAAFPAGNSQVQRAVNAALFRLKADGTLDELYLRWFPIGFY